MNKKWLIALLGAIFLGTICGIGIKIYKNNQVPFGSLEYYKLDKIAITNKKIEENSILYGVKNDTIDRTKPYCGIGTYKEYNIISEIKDGSCVITKKLCKVIKKEGFQFYNKEFSC